MSVRQCQTCAFDKRAEPHLVRIVSANLQTCSGRAWCDAGDGGNWQPTGFPITTRGSVDARPKRIPKRKHILLVSALSALVYSFLICFSPFVQMAKTFVEVILVYCPEWECAPSCAGRSRTSSCRCQGTRGLRSTNWRMSKCPKIRSWMKLSLTLQ